MPSIRDFSGGVLNQELQNLDKGAGVLFDCKNVLSSWNGELRKRTGTRLLRRLDENSKIIPYRLPNGDDMVLCLNGSSTINCYYFTPDGSLDTYKIGDESTNMFPAASSWSSDTNGNWNVGSSYSGNFYPALYPYKTLTIQDLDATGVTIRISNVTDGMVFKQAKFRWTCINTQAQIIRYDTDPIIQYSDDNISWTPVQTEISDMMTRTQTLSGGRISTIVEYSVYNNFCLEVHPYWRIVFRDKELQEAGARNNLSYLFYMGDVNCWTEVTTQPLIFSNCPYGLEDFDNIRWSQNGTTLTMAAANKPPYQIKVNSNGVFSDSEFIPSDAATIWTDHGYPRSVVYYQNRLWFGGFANDPTMVWSSAFGDFNNFHIPTTIESTSPIKATGTEITDPIENMFGGNNALYCLSADGISMIDAQGAIVATNQVEFKLRNREPVSPVAPTVKDDIMMYIGRDNRKILLTDYDFVVQRFKANCISNKYNNFLKSGIKEIHYIPRKSSLIYGLTSDGKWFSLLFDSSLGKNGLFPFESVGKILDLQPIKYRDETKLVIISQLNDGVFYLEEKIAQADQEIMDFMSADEKQEYTKSVMDSNFTYLDHSMKFVFETPQSIVNNLPYFEGEQIDIIADGNYLGSYTVLQDAETGSNYIDLEEPVSEVVLGYKYDSYAVLKFVTPYTERKFPKEIAVNFINTGYLEVGNTFDSLKSVLNNLVESVNISNKRILMNGNYAKTLDKHSFETPYVIVRSDKGLPFVLTGIDYRVDMSNYQGGV